MGDEAGVLNEGNGSERSTVQRKLASMTKLCPKAKAVLVGTEALIRSWRQREGECTSAMLHLNQSRIGETPGQKDSRRLVHTCKLDEIVNRGSMVLKEGTGMQLVDQTQYYCSNHHCKLDEGAHMVLKEVTLVQNMGNHCHLCK